MQNQVAIFIFADKDKVLVEERFIESLNQKHYLMPGGRVKENETLEDALKREAKEELGVDLLDFTQIPTNPEILGIHNQILLPFLINKWDGLLPEVILDKGNSLSWIEVEALLNAPFEPTRNIIKALLNFATDNIHTLGHHNNDPKILN